MKDDTCVFLAKTAPRGWNFYLIFALFCLVSVLSACGSQPVESFQWTDSSGKPLVFTQNSSFPKGSEGEFSSRFFKNTYTLRKTFALSQNESIAFSFDVYADGIVAGFAVKNGKGKTESEKLFELRKGQSTVYFNDGSGDGIKAVTVSVKPLSSGTGSTTGGDSGKNTMAMLGIKGISVAPYFKGFLLEKDGAVRISDGFGSRVDGKDTVWSISKSFQASMWDNRVLVLEYQGKSASNILVQSGSAVVKVKAESPLGEVLLPGNLFSSSADSITVRVPSGIQTTALYIKTENLANQPVDLGVILLEPGIPTGFDYSVYRWDLLPSVYAFDFRDYATQDRYLKRMAFFVEKNGYRGKLEKDTQIASLHGWNAHDYNAEDLASFYSAAEKTNFQLDREEIELRDFLVTKGIIRKSTDGFMAGAGAIISITRETEGYLRFLFLTHESTHAIFFVDDQYRAFATSMWNSMTKAEKWFWFLYFGWMYYDTSSSYLMANEMQAYLLQQPVSRSTEYFTKTLPQRLLEKHPELEKPLSDYMAAYGNSFKEMAGELDGWLRARYGFGAGMTFFVH
jgi:hypothetical protein